MGQTPPDEQVPPAPSPGIKPGEPAVEPQSEPAALVLRDEPVGRRLIRGFVSAASVGLVVSLFSSSLDAAGVKGLPVAYLYLCGIWIIGVVGTYVAESIWVLPRRLRWAILIGVALALGVACAGTGIFEASQYKLPKTPGPPGHDAPSARPNGPPADPPFPPGPGPKDPEPPRIHEPAPLPGRIAIDGVTFEAPVDAEGRQEVRLHLNNHGPGIAYAGYPLFSYRVTGPDISQEDVDKITADEILAARKERPKKDITVEFGDKYLAAPPTKLSNVDWKSAQAGRVIIYVWAIYPYLDASIASNKINISRFVAKYGYVGTNFSRIVIEEGSDTYDMRK